MKRFFAATAALLTVLTAFCSSAADAPEGEVWKPFQFMMGDWVSTGAGKATGEFSLAFDLDRRILMRRNHAKLPPKPGQNDGATHDDLMIIYPEPGKDWFRADYFDNEGHVIHYTVSFPAGKAVFESEAAANAPRFRLTYEQKPDGILGIDFAMASPGKEFKTYTSGTVRRK